MLSTPPIYFFFLQNVPECVDDQMVPFRGIHPLLKVGAPGKFYCLIIYLLLCVNHNPAFVCLVSCVNFVYLGSLLESVVWLSKLRLVVV